MSDTVTRDLEAFKDNFRELREWNEWRRKPPRSKEVRKRIKARIQEIFSALDSWDDVELAEAEQSLRVAVFALGRLFIVYFLARRQKQAARLEREKGKDGFRRRRLQSRIVGTWFGKVPFWRTYMKRADGSGICPLDRALGLTADTFSRTVVGAATRLATIVSYDRGTALLLNFLGWSPSKTSVEHAVLGIGRYSEEWFESKPAPEDDGDVLVIQIDSKATPTATEKELMKRRSKRKETRYPNSPRHRGREKRGRRGAKRRRKKGDKSKNGKAATLVVMYTLKTTRTAEGEVLRLGPINKEVYASYKGKRHAFAVARREADKRGFQVGSGKTIQVLTDGDIVLEQCTEEFFPDAEHTLDVYHALEYVWKAGGCLYEEGSDELEVWYEFAKSLVYNGKVTRVIDLLKQELAKVPRTGPGNKGKRKRLGEAISYLEARVGRMDYARLDRQDLELSTGAVEGAVRYVIGERFDCAGMRWIKERAEPLLGLRCIEVNGHWDEFIDFAYARLLDETSPSEQLPSMLLNGRYFRQEAA